MIPIGLILTSSPAHKPQFKAGRARQQVIAALSATIDSGSFDITFNDEPLTPPTNAATTTTAPCPASGPGYKMLCSYQGSNIAGLDLTGQGTIDTAPFAMVAVSQVPGLGKITAYANGTDVWELGGGNYGLSPGTDSGPGSSLPGFSNSVEGTLGPRQGAIDMMGLASPTGYLEIDQNAITSANQMGTGTVAGVAVTVYKFTMDPADRAKVPGATPEETIAIADALSVLQGQGYTGTTVTLSVDSAGFIRQTVSVNNFADGATQTEETTFSNFGCAGTVLMPGQTGSSAPPAGCTSPDSTSAES